MSFFRSPPSRPGSPLQEKARKGETKKRNALFPCRFRLTLGESTLLLACLSCTAPAISYARPQTRGGHHLRKTGTTSSVDAPGGAAALEDKVRRPSHKKDTDLHYYFSPAAVSAARGFASAPSSSPSAGASSDVHSVRLSRSSCKSDEKRTRTRPAVGVMSATMVTIAAVVVEAAVRTDRKGDRLQRSRPRGGG